jgi:hypothetical protein
MDTKSYWLFMALLAAIAIASLSGVEGQLQEQYLNPEAGYSTATPGSSQNPAQYSQFYGMTSGPAPSNPISAPSGIQCCKQSAYDNLPRRTDAASAV